MLQYTMRKPSLFNFVKSPLGLFVAAVLAFVGGLAGGLTIKGNDVKVEGTGNTVIAYAPSDATLTSLEICERGAEVSLVSDGIMTQRYQAKYVADGAQYDLTWQIGGTTVAVERLKDRDFAFWSERVDDAFWKCINAKQVTVREVHSD